MDAKRSFCIITALLLAPLAGCELFNARPDARPESKPKSEPADPPVVVSAPSSAVQPTPVASADETDTGDVNTDVAQYIARVDDLATRVGARPGDSPNVAAPPRPRHAAPPANEAPPTSTLEPEPPPAAPPEGPVASPTNAPRLAGVAVRAGDVSEAADVNPMRPTPAPTVNAPVSSSSASEARVKSLIDALPATTDNPTFRQQLDQRLAQVLAGQYEAAREPLTLVSDEQQQMASRFVEALIAVRDGHLGDPAAANSAALAAIEQLSDELRRGSDLRLPVLAICSSVSGFGQYSPIEPPVFDAGVESEFVVYVEVRDFVSERQGDGLYQTRFDLRTAVLNRAGDVAFEHLDADVVDRCRNRRSDCFIPRLVRLPATLSPGEYVVKVSVTDKLGKKVAENRTTIRVAASRRGSPG